MSLRIRSAEALPGHWLRLTLTDGSVVERGVAAALHGPVFEPLRSDPERFSAVTVEHGTGTWPGRLDLDPDVLIWDGPEPATPGVTPPATLEIGWQAGRVDPDR